MSSDEPFDFEAPDQPARSAPPPPASSPRPEARTAQRPPAGTAPGRRPAVRATSRARTGGAATPLNGGSTPRQAPPRQAPARQTPPSAQPRSVPPRTPGGSDQTRVNPSATSRTRTAEPPPSYRPEGASPVRGEAGQATRVMTAGTTTPPRTSAPRTAQSSGRGYGTRPPDAPPTATRPAPGGPGKKRRHRGRRVIILLVLALVLVLAWPIGLLIWANGKITHIDALSGDLGTPGTTYLLAGSDSRADGALEGDTTEGQRTDTIMLLTVPPSGNTSLISLPRDTYVDIPGYGPNKLNAAYAFGGAPLLVETVEQLTSIGVDHYVEIGMGGVEGLVDAVGGVELCLDYDVSDKDSGLEWEAGCHTVDGETALAFARMRKADPLGDIGRTQRQQQVIQAVTGQVAEPSLAFKPGEQVRLIDAGLGVLTVSEGTGILDLGRMALAFRAATGEDGVRGAPPIADLNYRPGGVGSSVLLDPDTAPAFFASVVDGTVTNEDTATIG